MDTYDDRFNEDTNGDMYVDRRALVPTPQFGDCLESSCTIVGKEIMRGFDDDFIRMKGLMRIQMVTCM